MLRLKNIMLICAIATASFSRVADAQSLGTIHVHVVAPDSPQARLILPTELNNGLRVHHLTITSQEQSATTLSGEYIELHGWDSRVTVTSGSPTVIDFPPGIYVYPHNVNALLLAKSVGDADISIYSGPAPNCGNVAVPDCNSNWSGYILPNGPTVTGVTAKWVVPGIQGNSPQGQSSTWVGIDGHGNGGNTVLQAGTEQDVHPWYDPLAGPIYYAWLETFPSEQELITPVPIPLVPSDTQHTLSPGDTVEVTIAPAADSSPTPGNTSNWTITFKDLNPTNIWTFTKTVSYNGALATSEWIEEATSGPSGVQTMADYGSVTFSPTTADSVGVNGGTLGSPNFDPSEQAAINQKGPSGIFSTPSNPSGDAEGFTVTYSEVQPSQGFLPGPWIDTTALPPGRVDQVYSQSIDVVNTATPIWTVKSGSLPPGLTLTSGPTSAPGTVFGSGTLSGTPTVEGTFQFSVIATDQPTGAFSQAQPFNMLVTNKPEATLQLACSAPGTIPDYATFNLWVDSTAVKCDPSATMILATGSHSLTASLNEVPAGSYKILYGGACQAVSNTDGATVTLTAQELARCVVSAEMLSLIENGGCSNGDKCCAGGPKGCLSCIPANATCP
jgi:hypothetical protein